jgi:hypothetical protein
MGWSRAEFSQDEPGAAKYGRMGSVRQAHPRGANGFREDTAMNIPLADALVQLKDELRKAVLESDKETVVFIPDEIELELSVGFEISADAKAGFKIFAIFDTSVDAGGKRTTEHKVTLKLHMSDKQGAPLKISDIQKRNF